MYMDNNKEVPSFDLIENVFNALVYSNINKCYLFFANDFINYVSKLKI